MRAAVLTAPGTLEVMDVPEPRGEVLVEVRAATACGTDLKMLRHGHRVLGPYPARFGHEMAGVRLDTGDPVLVGDSAACGSCAPCLAGRAQICRDMTWILGGFAERIAAPEAALHTLPPGLDFAVAAVAEPLAACIHAVARGTDAEDCAVLGGGTMGLMLARLLVLEGRRVTLVDRHPERRAQATGLGAVAVERFDRAHALVFEAVGRPQAWADAVGAAAPGGCVVLVGGCPSGTAAPLPTGPLHYEELDVRGAFHHDRLEVDRALWLLTRGQVDPRELLLPAIGLGELAAALQAPGGGAARKIVVDPSR
ncbi:alcohol dehydrogenase catalytic domain-containing protein [Conexibacter sp. W3-3-2]|uniref:zinc-dependent alcohol dehydrogenase n=1 Tax=Conexibacter sp. W3-3-2 TaxID=2675227 RepID=UPI0012B7DA86|nr:alcohol dehydrogenase catalytic domain-containing protein [Conexibacter sp. W3-3-2]MTD44179.1 alcohol dehydrogenase catalytic domain-containing protein [Conexibacter sp. W3-3-2]